jgi:Tetratricopeptide repeat
MARPVRNFTVAIGAIAALAVALGLIAWARRRVDLDSILLGARQARLSAEAAAQAKDWERADAFARRANVALDQVPASESNKPQYHFERAMTLDVTATIEMALDQMELVEAALTRAVDHWSQVVAADQTVIANRLRMGASLDREGTLYRDVGRWDEALANAQRGRALCESAPARACADRRIDLQWVDFLVQLGHLHGKMGHQNSAMECYASAVSAQQSLVQAYGQRVEDREHLVELMVGVAEENAARRQAADAERLLVEAIAAADALRTLSPAASLHKHDAALIRLKLADLIASNPARSSETRGLLETALAIERALAANLTADALAISNLADVSARIAEFERDSGKLDRAFALYNDEASLRKRLVSEHPQSIEYRFRLGVATHNLADLLRHRGERDEAMAMARQAIALLHPVYRENVLDGEHRTAISYAYWTLCALALDAQDHRAAAPAVALYQAIEPNGFEEAIESARFLSRCAGLAAADRSIDAQERERLARSYGDQSQSALASAITAGFHDAAELTQSPTFAPLRPRADFQQLVRAIEE